MALCKGKHCAECTPAPRCTAITYGGNPVVVQCARPAGHPGNHATTKELRHAP